jgi:hypothetical protein
MRSGITAFPCPDSQHSGQVADKELLPFSVFFEILPCDAGQESPLLVLGRSAKPFSQLGQWCHLERCTLIQREVQPSPAVSMHGL